MKWYFAINHYSKLPVYVQASDRTHANNKIMKNVKVLGTFQKIFGPFDSKKLAMEEALRQLSANP